MLAALWLMLLPIGTLPTELLVEIFTVSILDTLSTAPTSQVRILGHVCSYWPHIVNGTPKFGLTVALVCHWIAGSMD
jgi:hypothetical protein